MQEVQRMLGTEVSILIYSQSTGIQKDIKAAFEYLKDFEEEFSRFRTDSTLSRLNQIKRYRVSERFIEIFELSKRIHKETGGLFNPLINLPHYGYSNSFEQKKFQRTSGWINSDFHTTTRIGNLIILEENQLLDFGGLAKGYAVDLLYELLFLRGYKNFLINAGGDIRTFGSGKEQKGWKIGIENPFTQKPFATIDIGQKAVITSGGYRRNWKIQNESFHHIIHPQLQKSLSYYASILLIGEECKYIDGYSKAVFNLDPKKALSFLKKRGIDGMLIEQSGKYLTSPNFMQKYNFSLL